MNKLSELFRFKRNVLLLFLLLSFSLSLTGCNTQTGAEPKKVTGTTSLILDFVTNSLQDSVYESEYYYVPISLKNKGAEDINGGIVDVAFDSNILTLQNKDEFSRFDLKGDDGLFHGDETMSEIKFKANNFKIQGVNSFDTTIKINVCYNYKTHYQDSFCLDTDVRNQQNQKACLVNDLSGSGGSGAPVVVEIIKPRITPGENGAKASFTLKLSNLGVGTVLSKNSAERVCTSSFTKEDFGIITISEIAISTYKLSDNSIQCNSHTALPNQYNLVDENKNPLFCQITKEIPYDLGTFLTPVYIELDYGYLQSISKDIKIEKLTSTN